MIFEKQFAVDNLQCFSEDITSDVKQLTFCIRTEKAKDGHGCEEEGGDILFAIEQITDNDNVNDHNEKSSVASIERKDHSMILFSVKKNDSEQFQSALCKILSSHKSKYPQKNSLTLRIECMEKNNTNERPVYKSMQEVDSSTTRPEEGNTTPMKGTADVSDHGQFADASTTTSRNHNLPGQIDIPTAGRSVGTSIATHEVSFEIELVEQTNGGGSSHGNCGDTKDGEKQSDHYEDDDDDVDRANTDQEGRDESDRNDEHGHFGAVASTALTQSTSRPRYMMTNRNTTISCFFLLVVLSIVVVPFVIVKKNTIFSVSGHYNNNINESEDDGTSILTKSSEPSSLEPTSGPSFQTSTTTTTTTGSDTTSNGIPALDGTGSPLATPTEDLRESQIFACAYILSRGQGFDDQDDDENCRNNNNDVTISNNNNNDDSPQRTAAKWFIDGGGVLIDVPSDEETCIWDTSFGILYSLIVIRESLCVPDATWYRNTYAEPIRSIQQICLWKRIVCDPTTIIRGIDNTQNDGRDDGGGTGGTGGSSIRLTSLILQNAGLKGTIPHEVIGLGSKLETFKIDNNPQVYGTIPSDIGTKLTNLQYLYLQLTSISGTVPSSLGNLTSLRQLLVDRTALTGTMPSEICNLRHSNGGILWGLRADCQTGHEMICDFPTCCTKCF